MMRVSLTGICILILNLLAMGYARQGEAQALIDSTAGGHHYIQHFEANDYNGEAQNWTVEQAADGLIYVGNNLGILEYDGVNWRLIRTPPKSLIRSLALHHDGAIYVSSIGDIGVLKPDSLGIQGFQSLLSTLPPEDQNVDDVLVTLSLPDGVYFQALDRLIRISGSESKVWRNTEIFVRAFAVQDRVYLDVQDQGLMKLRNDSLVFASGGATFKNDRISAVFPHDEDSYLVITQHKGMFRCAYTLPEDTACTLFNAGTSKVLADVLPYSGIQLADGSFVIGTFGEGILFINQKGNITHWLTEEDGLSSNSVMGFNVDEEQGLWLATANGVNRLSLRAPLTYFDETLGFERMPSGDMLRYKNTLYIATFQGVYSLQSDNQRFTRDPFIQDQCPALFPSQVGLLVGCRNGVYNLDKKRKIDTPEGISVYNIFRPSWDSTRVYLGLRYGLAWLDLRDQAWEFGGRMDIGAGVYKSIEDKEGRMWISTIKDGIYLMELDQQGHPHKWKQYGSSHGVPAGLLIADKLAGEVVFKLWDGKGVVLKPVVDGDSVSFIHHEIHSQMPASIDNRILNFVEDEQGWVWIFNREQSTVAIPNNEGTYTFKPSYLRTSQAYNAYSMYADTDGVIWVASPEGMIRIVKERAIPSEYSFSPLIRKVTTPRGGILHGGGMRDEREAPIWPDTTKNLRFYFSSTQFDAPQLARFRTRLEGLEDSWSVWTDETDRDFTNLSEGSYTFFVQARNGHGIVSDATSFSFVILPPWYRTVWAYALWGLAGLMLFAGGVWGVNQYQTRRLQARNKLLNRLVEEKTEEIRGKNALLQNAYDEVQTINDTLRQANDSLQERTDRLRDTLEANKEILGITAHDLKNPLGGIIGLAELVLTDARGHPPSSHESVVDNISLLKDEAERMLRIVKDLLDKHREGEHITLKKEKAILGDIISAVLRWNEQQALHKNITLHYETGDAVIVEVDVVSMQRVLDNYVSNAIKYSPFGKNVWIEVTKPGDLDDVVRISVRDEGPGLTVEDKTKVFGKLQRLSAKPTDGEHSSGMGLYIVKKLVEAHGGSVGVESEGNLGATFWILIPVCVSKAPKISGAAKTV